VTGVGGSAQIKAMRGGGRFVLTSRKYRELEPSRRSRPISTRNTKKQLERAAAPSRSQTGHTADARRQQS